MTDIAHTATLSRSLVALLIGAATLTGAFGPAAPGAPATAPAVSADTGQLDGLYSSCMDAMAASTCRLTADASSAVPESAVFVAGVGAVDAASYRQLRESGDAMCSLTRQACADDWSGVRCQTARSLWGVAPPAVVSSADPAAGVGANKAPAQIAATRQAGR